jgi:hypothetical protein
MVFRFMALLVVVASVVWILRRVLPPSAAGRRAPGGYDFTIDFLEGRKSRVKGVVPRTVYNAFEDVAALTRVSGTISASRDGSLRFSDEMPEGVRQQFRNAWWAGRGR